jgi:hypothetical protein
VDGAPIALVGPANLDAMALARALHDAATGCDLLVVEDTPVPSLATIDGTLVIDLDRVRRLTAPRVEEIFAARCGTRVIFLATDERLLRRHLDVYAARVRTIGLVPLARRGGDVARLIEFVWREELGSDLLTAELDPASLRGLAEHRWRGNLDELRAAAARLLAYATHPSLRRAAQALGVRHQTLSAHLARMGVPILDQAERELGPVAMKRMPR